VSAENHATEIVMNHITADPGMLIRLQGVAEPVEIHDEHGKVRA